MFHNIFEKLKIRRQKIKQKPRIVIDIHEKNSMILSELKSNNEIELLVHSLKIGDYLIGSTIIERKTINDFVSSMLNKRLVEQLRHMRKYKSRILIIEGNLKNLYPDKGSSLNPNAIRGFILSIMANYNTNVIFTMNYEDTINYLITLAKQQLKSKADISLHSRIPKTIKEQKKYILEAFPNIGPKKAEKLLDKFKTLNQVFNSSEEELKEILKNRAKEFKVLLNS